MATDPRHPLRRLGAVRYLLMVLAAVMGLSSCTGSEPDLAELAPSDLGTTPQSALEFYTSTAPLDPDAESDSRVEYLLLERDWEVEEWATLAAGLKSATTETELMGDAERAAAAQLVSEAVHYLSERGDLDEIREDIVDGEAASMAPSLASMLTHYLLGIDLHNSPLEAKGAEPGVLKLYVDGVGYVDNIPHLDEHSLKSVARLAVATDEGVATLREGVGEFRASYITRLAKHAAAKPDDGRTLDILHEGLGTDARLTGMYMSVVGDDAIAEEFYQSSWKAISKILNDSGLSGAQLLNAAGYEEEYRQELTLDMNGLPAS